MIPTFFHDVCQMIEDTFDIRQDIDIGHTLHRCARLCPQALQLMREVFELNPNTNIVTRILQLPHLELTREIARRFNSFYGPVFPEPEARLTYKNTEGYADPTCFYALCNVMRDEKRRKQRERQNHSRQNSRFPNRTRDAPGKKRFNTQVIHYDE